MGRILKLFNSIKTSKRWRRNSNLYQDVVNSMEAYTKQMQEDVTEQSAQKLYDISKTLKEKAELYLRFRKEPKTTTGKARYSMVQEIANLNMLPDELRDPIRVNRLKQGGKKLSEIVDEIRNNTVVDITNQKNKKVYGAGASKRVRFDYMGRDGFFTQEVKVEKNTVIIERERARFEAEKKAIFEKMRNNGMLKAAEVPSIIENKTNQQIIQLIAEGAGRKISDFTEEELRAIVDYHKTVSKAANMSETARDEANIVNDSEMSRRNAATSRMAHMLGMGATVAFSENVIVVDDGVEMKGSFMAAAIGYDTRSTGGMEAMVGKEFDFTSPNLQRDISRMQVFDMLCGQIDRHGGNFLYQISPNPVNGKYQITGIQGIDNDMSFGLVNLNRWNKQIVPITELNAIDEGLLQSLRELTPEKIEYTMGEMLNKQEVDAVVSRRNQILEHVDSGKVRIVKSTEWGQNTIPLMEENHYYREIKKEIATVKQELGIKHDEVVADYDDAVKRIEEYNREHPEKPQEFPTKPAHYDEYKEEKVKRQMEAIKARYEKTMTNFENAVREANKRGMPMPPVPEGYAAYKRERETREMMANVEVIPERKEVSLDELSDTKTQSIPMSKSQPEPSKKMDMSKE